MQRGVVKGMWPEVLMEQHLHFITYTKKGFLMWGEKMDNELLKSSKQANKSTCGLVYVLMEQYF